MYSGIATSFFCQAKKILRRSTAESDEAETKRVGAVSAMVCGIGWRKYRWVALARSSVAFSSESSEEVVGVGRLPAAIARRRARSGSWRAGSMEAMIAAETVVKKD
jgi:hypothetical protein